MVDSLTLAAAIDPADPTWVRADISWPTDPDRWEAARWALAQILERPHALPFSIYLPTVLARPG